MIVGVVVNFRRPQDTLESLASLLASDCPQLARVVLVDQMPETDCDGHAALLARVASDVRIHYVPVCENLGFAGGCNRAFDLVFGWDEVKAVFLLNNDATVAPDCVARLAAALRVETREEMIAAAMMRYDAPAEVDSLGIVFFGCGLAANRAHAAQPLLGPCGGAALYGIGLLRAVHAQAGHVFDPDFFCYAEDTDLALRARALGYRPVYVDGARVLHKGSQTSGGSGSDLVVYYGLRNSFVTLVQSMPAMYFLRFLHYFPLLLCALTLKYARERRLRLLLKVVRDTLKRLPRAWRSRRHLVRACALRWSDVRDGIDTRFYDRDYLRTQLCGLMVGVRRRAP